VEVRVNGSLGGGFSGPFSAGDVFVIRGRGGNDTFNIESTPADVTVELHGGSGVDEFFIGLGSSGVSNLDLDVVQGNVIVDGGADPDLLALYDMNNLNDNNTFAVTSTEIDRTSLVQVDYSSTETVQVFGARAARCSSSRVRRRG
jgi:hypothetical protein